MNEGCRGGGVENGREAERHPLDTSAASFSVASFSHSVRPSFHPSGSLRLTLFHLSLSVRR